MTRIFTNWLYWWFWKFWTKIAIIGIYILENFEKRLEDREPCHYICTKQDGWLRPGGLAAIRRIVSDDIKSTKNEIKKDLANKLSSYWKSPSLDPFCLYSGSVKYSPWPRTCHGVDKPSYKLIIILFWPKVITAKHGLKTFLFTH